MCDDSSFKFGSMVEFRTMLINLFAFYEEAIPAILYRTNPPECMCAHT